MNVTVEQYKELLKPQISTSRISSRKQGNTTLSYVEAWDVKAQLIRTFGFGQFSADVIANEFRYEQENISADGKSRRYEVAYTATVRLTIPQLGCTYTESAVGSAYGSRAEAHDNAIKNAASDALKRAAIYLGTQFGLSLYNNGSRQDVIRKTLCPPEGYVEEDTAAPAADDDNDDFLMELFARALHATTEDALKVIWSLCGQRDALDVALDDDGVTMRSVIMTRLAELREGESA